MDLLTGSTPHLSFSLHPSRHHSQTLARMSSKPQGFARYSPTFVVSRGYGPGGAPLNGLVPSKLASLELRRSPKAVIVVLPAAGEFPLRLTGKPVLPARLEPPCCPLFFGQLSAEFLGLGVTHEINRMVGPFPHVLAHRAVAHRMRLAGVPGTLFSQRALHDRVSPVAEKPRNYGRSSVVLTLVVCTTPPVIAL